MQRNLEMRHRMWKEIRDFYDEEGFLEIETPFLTKSHARGRAGLPGPAAAPARTFLRPAAVPQLFKTDPHRLGVRQVISRSSAVFRDEDTRANRALEFTQLDVEMSFVRGEDV